MPQQNKTTLQTAINTQIADNTSGAISAADVRDNLINMTDSLLFNTGSAQSITGSLIVTGGITGSLQGTATTASYVVTAQTASYVLNAVSASHAQTASYVNPLNQEVILTGNITASGDLRLTTAGNAVIRPIIDLVPDGTATFNPNTTTTTAYANYGINVITTATNTDYCFRLPQTPIEGKSVTIVNKSGINVVLFPSVAGGSINGVIDGAEIIPSDGKSYTFDCYENPLPGGWSLSTSPSAGNVSISTGEINWNYNSTASSTIAYVNDGIKAVGDGVVGYPPYMSIFANNYDAGSNVWNFGGINYNFAYSQILPDTIPGQGVWKSIDNIQIQTNISATLANDFYVPTSFGNNLSYLYNPSNPNYNYPSNTGPWAGPASWFANSAYTNFSSSIYVPWFASRPGTNGNSFGGSGGGSLPLTISTVPGTFTPSLSSPYTSNNVGDPGTFTLNINTSAAYLNSLFFRWLGRNLIGSFYHPSDGLIDVWYTQTFGLYLAAYSNVPFIPNIKFITTLNVQI